MGNITGTLIQNAFQTQPLDIQEEVKKLTRDSPNRELYRLLHAEMEHSAKEKTNAAHRKTEISENDDFGRGTVKAESPRSVGEHCRVQGGFGPQQHSQPQGIAFDARCGNVAAAGYTDEKKVDAGAKPVAGQEESSGAPRMAFKKKILNSYRTETDDTCAQVEKSAIDAREPEIKREFSTCNNESVGNGSIDIDHKSLTKVLNFDSCIQVIVMNELQKLESLPSDVPGGKKLELFGILDAESQKNKHREVVGNDTAKDRCSAESSWLSRIEKSAGQSVNRDPKRDKWPQYVPLESSPSQIPDKTLHSPAPRKAEFVSQNSVLLHNMPSVYQTIGHLFEPTVTQEIPRMYSSGASDGCAQGSRQVASQLGEIAGEVSMSRGPLPKFSHPGTWGHSQEFPGVQSSPHLLSADPAYRLTPSSQMTHHLVDHHRKVDKDMESAKLPRSEYISCSGPAQYPVIHHGQIPQHLSYQNSLPALPEKRHKMDTASYLYPAKMAPQERVLSQYETSYLNQPETLQAPVMNYLKSKKSPILAYDKELLCPLGEPQYNRAELPDMSPGSASAGSIRNYRTAADPLHIGYYGDRKGRQDVQTHKRTYAVQNAEEFEFEKHFRRTAEVSQDVPVPVGTDQHAQRSFPGSYFPRGRENLVRGVGGPSDETPLDLTVKKDVGSGHRASVSLLSSGARQHQPDWDMPKSAGYKLAYTREESQVQASVFRAAASQQKVADFAVPEQIARRGEALDAGRSAYDKAPPCLTLIQPDSDFGRAILMPAQERNVRSSVIASHPFDDTTSGLGPPSHAAMQRMSEALMKNQLHSVNSNWRQPTYQEMLSQGRDLLLDTDSSFRGGPERTKPRPNVPNSDMLHLSTTSSPTIPHLSPIQPLVAPTGMHGGRRLSGPSLLGSHSPSDILHLQCKVCGSTYGSLRSFRMHFAKVHGLEPLPEHCNISTISGTKNAMSKVTPVDDNEPPALQRETLPLDVGSFGKTRTYDFDQYSNGSRSVRPSAVISEVPSVGARTKQVAEVYPMPVRATQGFSPQLKLDPLVRRPEMSDVLLEQTQSKTKPIDPKQGGHLVDCDLGVIRSRNCYGDLGCDVDCPECLDGFEDISDWKMHISTHMMRSCTCKACDLSFTHSGALKKHLQTAHLPMEKVDVEYRCLFCREVFCDEKVLFQHTQEHEKKYSRVDNSRRDGGLLQSNKQHHASHASLDSECIQMAVPDTTSSDDVRPTSGYGENSNNHSPSTGSKGSSYGRKSFAELLVMSGQSTASADNIQRFGDIKAEDEKACQAGMTDLGEKMRFGRSDGYSSGYDLGQGGTDTTTSLARSPSASSGAEKEFRPAKAPEEMVGCVSKKQAFLKRFKSAEEKQLVEGEPSRASPSSVRPNSSGTAAVPVENSEGQQPLHLRDLFSIMGHQVEKSICGMSDFPPVSSFVPTQRSRCVRDVCDEIIVQSFRKEKSPREPVSSISVLESLEMNANDKIKEQFKALVSMELETQLQDVARMRCGTGGQSSVWIGSPCSSHDSYHSLEIDESQSDKEHSAEDAGKTGFADLERRGTACEFPRQESEQKNSSDPSKSRKYDVRGDGQNPESGIGGLQATDLYFCNRQGGLECPESESSVCRPAATNLKESCSPTSTEKPELSGGEGDVNSDTNAKTSDLVLTSCHGQKRRHFSSDASVSKDPSGVDGDTEPLAKRPSS